MRWRRRRLPALPDDGTGRRRARRLGLAGLAGSVLVLTASAVAYTHPFAGVTYRAELGRAGGLRPGDEVRIAGIAVGKVAAVKLAGNHVDVAFSVQRAVPVGNESTLDIKLLTPLGGHYVALTPRGGEPLGTNVIPVERTTTPFELGDLIEESTPRLTAVDGDTIHDTFTELAAAMNAHPTAVGDVLDTASTLAGLLRENKGDFHRLLAVSEEYSAAAVRGGRDLVVMVQQFAIIGDRLASKTPEIVEAFALFAEMGRILDRFATSYARHLQPTVVNIDKIFDELFTHPEKLGEAAVGLGQILTIVWPMLSGNGVIVGDNTRLIPGQDVCIPSLIKKC